MGAEQSDSGQVSTPASTLADIAFAKVNLTLRILGKRPDGYHEIESLVAFADVGDHLTFVPGGEMALAVDGPLASQAGPDDENLVIKAGRALARQVPGLTLGRFTLTKYLPAQAGIGGGSADAAAALRLLARANSLARDDSRLQLAARETGADVPVCLDAQPRWMRGIGEILSAPLSLPRLPAVLLRPDVALATRDVFRTLGAPPLLARSAADAPDTPAGEGELISFLAARTNDLERPATAVAPEVVEALSMLRSQPSCVLARMSGSGSACFGLFGNEQAAAEAARTLAAMRPKWWVKPTTVGAVQ